jgi:hypothetical protein
VIPPCDALNLFRELSTLSNPLVSSPNIPSH